MYTQGIHFLHRITRMKRANKTATRREAIIIAALSCFIEKGFHQTSMRDIASGAGVSLGNLYNHFSDKTALIAEVASAESDEIRTLLPLLAVPPSWTALEAFAEAYLTLCCHPETVALTCEVLAEVARSPHLASAFGANRRQLLDALLGLLTRMQACGDIRKDVLLELFANTLLDAIEGMALRSSLFGEPLDRSTVKKLVHRLFAAQET